MEDFFRFFFLGKRVSRLGCQNVYCFNMFICCVSVFIEGVSWIFCFTFSGVHVSEGIFMSCIFVCQRVVLLYLGVVSRFL